MAVFDDLNVRNNDLVRKGMAGIIFVAPLTADPVTAITDPATGELVELPTGYSPFGWVSEDGVTWPRETEASDIYGWGGSEPVRTDIRRSTKRLTCTAFETKKTVLEEYLGFSLASVTTSTGGESVFDEPELPTYPYRRVIVIARDTAGTGDYYLGKHYPRAKVTEVSEQTWADSDTPVTYQLTYTAFLDRTVGTAVRHFLGGPGRSPVDEGFPAAGSSSS